MRGRILSDRPRLQRLKNEWETRNPGFRYAPPGAVGGRAVGASQEVYTCLHVNGKLLQNGIIADNRRSQAMRLRRSRGYRSYPLPPVQGTSSSSLPATACPTVTDAERDTRHRHPTTPPQCDSGRSRECRGYPLPRVQELSPATCAPGS